MAIDQLLQVRLKLPIKTIGGLHSRKNNNFETLTPSGTVLLFLVFEALNIRSERPKWRRKGNIWLLVRLRRPCTEGVKDAWLSA